MYNRTMHLALIRAYGFHFPPVVGIMQIYYQLQLLPETWRK
jgi:hypothetical protein